MQLTAGLDKWKALGNIIVPIIVTFFSEKNYTIC